jgi:hypothetical protein
VHQQHTNHRCVLCSGPFVAEVPIDEEKSRSAAPDGAELPSSLVAEPHLGHRRDGRRKIPETVQRRCG